jgi:hypothetical protein
MAALLTVAQAATADDDAAERARITAERAAVEARLVERERECATRFVVTACVEDAQREQRAALASLRQQQALLDEAQRKQRAAERLDRLLKPRENEPRSPAAKREAREARAARSPSEASLAASAAQPKPSPPVRPRKGGAPHDANNPIDPIARQTQEAARQADFAARGQAAQAHRTAVEQRQVERLKKKGRVAHPLPVPASAATP